MKCSLFCIGVIALFARLTGCSSLEPGPADGLAPADLIEVRFNLLNEMGKSDTIFKEGENLRFQLLIINKTNKQIALSNPIFDDPDFCRVFKTDITEGPLSEQSVGRPWDSIFCNKKGANPLLAKDTLELTIAWQPDLNGYRTGTSPLSFFCLSSDHQNPLPLLKGDYVTRFETAFKLLPWEGEWVTTDRRKFAINFHVR